MEKIIEKFIKKYLENGTYATKEELYEVLNPVLSTVKEHPDYTPEEWVDILLDDNIRSIYSFMEKNPIVPGYTVGISTGNIDVQLISGFMNKDSEMQTNALFDIASITKFYTQIIAYNLIKEGTLSFEYKIKEIDPRFENLGELTIGDIMRFGVKLSTTGRIDDNETIDKAYECLYGASIKPDGIGQYDYNDIGMMILKEVVENITGKSYKELVDEYILSKIGLHETFLTVPFEKRDLITGTPNSIHGLPNDQNAIALGGCSGHAGIFVSDNDLKILGRCAANELMAIGHQHHLWTEGLKFNRGIMGNSYITKPDGFNSTIIDKRVPLKTTSFQGSTRTQLTFGEDFANTVLLNPASISLEQEEELKEKYKIKVKRCSYIRDGKRVEYLTVDAREAIPIDNVSVISSESAKATIRFMLLNEILEQSKSEKKIYVKKRI